MALAAVRRIVVATGFLALAGGIGWGMMKATVPSKEELLNVSGFLLTVLVGLVLCSSYWYGSEWLYFRRDRA